MQDIKNFANHLDFRLLDSLKNLIANNFMIWHFRAMPRETIILECTEACKEGKQPLATWLPAIKIRTDPVERKYNRFLRRYTLHKEIKG